MILTDANKREFAERGYIVVRSVLSRGEIDAAMRVVDDLIAATPPPDGHCGHHFYWPALSPGHPLLGLLLDGAAFDVAEQLIRPGRLTMPRQAQVALNIPPYPHRPGRGHIDGVTPTEDDGRPGTFTMLAGLMLTDQTVENAGNLWVWPGTHRAQEVLFRERGSEALRTSRGLPDIPHGASEQVIGRAGDLLLAHYMLSHNIGGNTSPNVRRVIYYRLQREGHRERWHDCLGDLWLEYDAVRAALGAA
ncbi:MAG: phytanoyl-CoA dioxygenase [Candidatus Rokuibacteriota bacterium]|nr:MAG: phytanoyl-CoA dioxygenase [Candidatus Rokubacteria bacterium]